MEFTKLVEQIIKEDSVSGGSDSVFGSNVVATASEFSGDNYAPGDARHPYGIYGGVLTRKGLKKKKKKSKRSRKNKK